MEKRISIPEHMDNTQFLRDNCDSVEMVGYTKPFTEEELTEFKEELAQSAIEIADLETEKKEVMDDFKSKLKPLQESSRELIENLKKKARYTEEQCFKFIDYNSGQVGFYNSDGVLVDSRALRPQEMQKTIFTELRKTGTND